MVHIDRDRSSGKGVMASLDCYLSPPRDRDQILDAA